MLPRTLSFLQERVTTVTSLEAFPCPNGLLSGVSKDNTYSETTPKFGLDYTFEPVGPVDSLMTYVSAARGFKSGWASHTLCLLTISGEPELSIATHYAPRT